MFFPVGIIVLSIDLISSSFSDGKKGRQKEIKANNKTIPGPEKSWQTFN